MFRKRNLIEIFNSFVALKQNRTLREMREAGAEELDKEASEARGGDADSFADNLFSQLLRNLEALIAFECKKEG